MPKEYIYKESKKMREYIVTIDMHPLVTHGHPQACKRAQIWAQASTTLQSGPTTHITPSNFRGHVTARPPESRDADRNMAYNPAWVR